MKMAIHKFSPLAILTIHQIDFVTEQTQLVMVSNLNEDFIGFDVSEIDWHESYRMLIHCVAPRPIAFVSTLSKKGEPNLAPFSFFMGGGANPPSVAFSPGTEAPGKLKDTLINIMETKEYTINVVSHDIITKMNRTSYSYPHGVSEWEKSGLTMAPAKKSVRPM